MTIISVGKCFCLLIENRLNKKTLLHIDFGRQNVGKICALLAVPWDHCISLECFVTSALIYQSCSQTSISSLLRFWVTVYFHYTKCENFLWELSTYYLRLFAICLFIMSCWVFNIPSFLFTIELQHLTLKPKFKIIPIWTWLLLLN